MNLKSKIGWCTATWNPVTGCLHGPDVCPCSAECFARGIARRFGKKLPDLSLYPHMHPGCHMLDNRTDGNHYPFLFEPTFHAYRLDKPVACRKPQNIFVGDMGDLFGMWVPDEWIKDVYAACAKAPQHNYMFLTKNPQRYISQAKMWRRFWYGASVCNQKMLLVAVDSFFSISGFINQFLSIEPLMEPLDFTGKGQAWLRWGQWVIVGALTGAKAAAHRPRREWVEAIVKQCREAKVPVFLKDNLAGVWGEPLIQEFPEGLKANAGRNCAVTEPTDERKCRVCGCTDRKACKGGCWWMEYDLCSNCVGKE